MIKPILNGTTLFNTLTRSEQQQALMDWQALLSHGDELQKCAWQTLMENTARHQRMRLLFIERLPLAKRIELMQPHLAAILDETQWLELIRLFYRQHRERLTTILLEAAGMDDDNDTIPSTEQWREALNNAHHLNISIIDLAHAINALPFVANGDDQRACYCHLAEAWQQQSPQWVSESTAVVQEPPVTQAAPVLVQAGMDDFTTLDEVIHQHIIATALQESGALSHDKIADLLDELLHLNSRRTHHYFHIGFADALLLQHEIKDVYASTTMDGLRKAWYVTGWLAACVHQGDDEAFKTTYATWGYELEPYIGTSGFMGTALANHLFDYMAAHQYHHEALNMLKAMIQVANDRFVIKALQAGEQLLHLEGPGIALDYLTQVVQRMEQASAGFDAETLFRAKRRYGQVLQAMGRFTKALEYFEALNQSAPRAELFADIALLRAGFRALHEVRLKASKEQQQGMLAALSKAVNDAEQAVALVENAANANYILAMTAFLRFRNHQQTEDGEQAQYYARQAVVGMLLSRARRFYETMGMLSTAQFIEVSMLVYRINSADVPDIHSKWSGIHSLSMIPEDDVVFFLEGVSLVDASLLPDIAIKLIESHAPQAWHLFCRSGVLPQVLRHGDESVLTYLQQAMHSDREEPNAEAYAQSMVLLNAMPQSPNSALLELGRDALDVMEHSAWHNSALRADFDQYLLDKKHLLFWSEEDGLWARVYLARIMGNDTRCAALMPELFYLYRDQRGNAALQILEQCKAWQIDRALIQQLKQALPTDSVETTSHSSAPQPVRIVFIGGNEIQQRYDDDVIAWVGKTLPHVRLRFEHTGWSSNWNRELDHLLSCVKAADVVVLMCMMRTTLGRHLRKKIDRPWVPCTGSGRGAIQLSIQEASRVVGEQRRSSKP
ncbi:MAG: hypothetical protein Q9M09_02215 [Mariprofundaceae bacterium]|nr:hypothetical protein [Mariprofundaceae bacterium]